MCECLDCPNAGSLKVKTTRRKLWEIDERWMCAVIGTCLGVDELRKIAAEAKLRFPDGAPSDYQLHGALVQLAKQPGTASRLAHKLLERKFAVQVGRFNRAGCPGQLRRLWDEAKAKGEVPGAYWAVASHPLLPTAFGEQVFGEIHMMSHLAGAAYRAELRRQSEIETRATALDEELRRARAGAARAFAERDRQIRDLERKAARLAEETQRRERVEMRLAELERDDDRRALRKALDEAGKGMARSAAVAAGAEARAAIAEARADTLAADNAELSRELAELRASLAGLEMQAANDAAPDLVGRSVLYVGGRSRLMPHLQAAIRRCNGELMHHDGGLADGCAKLEGALERADVVVCPIDCVSHEAVDRIKQACRRCHKPFVPLRGVGVAAFLRGLQTVAPSVAAE